MNIHSAKTFEWQIGFVGPYCYFDASPTDFLRLAPCGFDVQGRAAPINVPTETAIVEAAQALSSFGADLIAESGGGAMRTVCYGCCVAGDQPEAEALSGKTTECAAQNTRLTYQITAFSKIKGLLLQGVPQ